MLMNELCPGSHPVISLLAYTNAYTNAYTHTNYTQNDTHVAFWPDLNALGILYAEQAHLTIRVIWTRWQQQPDAVVAGRHCRDHVNDSACPVAFKAQ